MDLTDSNETPTVSTKSEIELANERIAIEDKKIDHLLRFNTCYYLFMFIVIGLPVWYITTTTYRAPLPFDQIDEISFNKDFEFLLKIELISFNKQLSDDTKNQLLNEIRNSIDNESFKLKIDLEIYSRKSNENEEKLAKNF